MPSQPNATPEGSGDGAGAERSVGDGDPVRDEVSAGLIPMARLEGAAAVMRVLAHPHRLRICELLSVRRVSVNGLAAHLAIPANAVSQHLGMMRAHRLVEAGREGKEVYYKVVDPRPGWLLGCIRGHEADAGEA